MAGPQWMQSRGQQVTDGKVWGLEEGAPVGPDWVPQGAMGGRTRCA